MEVPLEYKQLCQTELLSRSCHTWTVCISAILTLVHLLYLCYLCIVLMFSVQEPAISAGSWDVHIISATMQFLCPEHCGQSEWAIPFNKGVPIDKCLSQGVGIMTIICGSTEERDPTADQLKNTILLAWTIGDVISSHAHTQLFTITTNDICELHEASR